jgi:Type I phosphodiesterase / nucleotide pyrophosphatase
MLVALVSCTGDSGSETNVPDEARGAAARQPPVGDPTGPSFKSACAQPIQQLRALRRGYYPGRSPEIVVVPQEPDYFGSFAGTTHSGPWDYVQRVPLVFYGPGFIKPVGEIDPARETTLADVAPTLAELLNTPWPKARPGRPIQDVLLPPSERAGVPRLVVVLVWDGGGWDVLDQWPDAWPELRALMTGGASVAGATVGSSPSVTPAIHATIGTGTFPKQHGIVDIPLRDGDDIAGSWDAQSPTYLEVRTLADSYDLAAGNEPEVGMIAEKGWHLGLVGHGAALEGADKDVAVMGDPESNLYTNPEFYSLPAYLKHVAGFQKDVRAVDAGDGALDSQWLGHDVLENPAGLRVSPVWTLYQTRLLKALIRQEGFGSDDVADLLLTNFKQIDLIGHAYNMLQPEVEDGIRYSDAALGKLVDFFDRRVGSGRWVLAMTADHGQSPDAAAVGAWPIEINEFVDDIESHFKVKSHLVQEERPGALWIDARVAADNDISLEEISDYVLRYRIRDNAAAFDDVPAQYEDRFSERLFATAFPYTWMPQVWDCAKRHA